MSITAEPELATGATPRPVVSILPRLAGVVGLTAAIAGTLRAGVGSAVVLSALALGLVVVVRGRSGLVKLVLAAVLLLPFLVIRDNSWLALCIVFTSGLVGAFVAVAGAAQQRVFDFRLGSIFRMERPQVLSSNELPAARSSFPLLSLIRGGCIATFTLMVFWFLLADADLVFRSVIDIGVIPFGRVGFGVLAASVFAVAAALAALDNTTTEAGERRWLGMLECTMVLGALNLLFLAFVALRLGNLGTPLSEDAWRSEVRSGFFQLLFVAALTIALVLTLRRAVRMDEPAERKRFKLLAWSTVVLAGLIDIIALQRIAEYVDRNFMTPLRWWSFGFGLFLMAVLVLVAVRVAGWRSDREWMSGAMVVTWLGFLAVMALSNPDKRMAEYNFDNPRPSDGVISVQALFWLSEDATPVIVENLEALRPLSNTRYERMIAHLCQTEPQQSWRHLNFARSDAGDATQELCGPLT